MRKTNKIISLLISICFLFNTIYADIALSQPNIASSDTLALPGATDDITGLLRMDLLRLQWALETEFARLVNEGRMPETIESLSHALNVVTVTPKGIKGVLGRPAEVHLFFNKPEPWGENYRVMARVSKKPRTYWIVFSLKPDNDGRFVRGIYTEDMKTELPLIGAARASASGSEQRSVVVKFTGSMLTVKGNAESAETEYLSRFFGRESNAATNAGRVLSRGLRDGLEIEIRKSGPLCAFSPAGKGVIVVNEAILDNAALADFILRHAVEKYLDFIDHPPDISLNDVENIRNATIILEDISHYLKLKPRQRAAIRDGLRRLEESLPDIGPFSSELLDLTSAKFAEYKKKPSEPGPIFRVVIDKDILKKVEEMTAKYPTGGFILTDNKRVTDRVNKKALPSGKKVAVLEIASGDSYVFAGNFMEGLKVNNEVKHILITNPDDTIKALEGFGAEVVLAPQGQEWIEKAIKQYAVLHGKPIEEFDYESLLMAPNANLFYPFSRAHLDIVLKAIANHVSQIKRTDYLNITELSSEAAGRYAREKGFVIADNLPYANPFTAAAIENGRLIYSDINEKYMILCGKDKARKGYSSISIKSNVIFMAPHPDDPEIAAGGLIRNLVEKGVIVSNWIFGSGHEGVILPDDERRESGEEWPEWTLRRGEARRSADVLNEGVAGGRLIVNNLDLRASSRFIPIGEAYYHEPDFEEGVDFLMKGLISYYMANEKNIKEEGAMTVVLPDLNDRMPHHRTATQMALEALKIFSKANGVKINLLFYKAPWAGDFNCYFHSESNYVPKDSGSATKSQFAAAKSAKNNLAFITGELAGGFGSKSPTTGELGGQYTERFKLSIINESEIQTHNDKLKAPVKETLSAKDTEGALRASASGRFDDVKDAIRKRFTTIYDEKAPKAGTRPSRMPAGIYVNPWNIAEALHTITYFSIDQRVREDGITHAITQGLFDSLRNSFTEGRIAAVKVNKDGSVDIFSHRARWQGLERWNEIPSAGKEEFDKTIDEVNNTIFSKLLKLHLEILDSSITEVNIEKGIYIYPEEITRILLKTIDDIWHSQKGLGGYDHVLRRDGSRLIISKEYSYQQFCNELHFLFTEGRIAAVRVGSDLSVEVVTHEALEAPAIEFDLSLWDSAGRDSASGSIRNIFDRAYNKIAALFSPDTYNKLEAAWDIVERAEKEGRILGYKSGGRKPGEEEIVREAFKEGINAENRRFNNMAALLANGIVTRYFNVYDRTKDKEALLFLTISIFDSRSVKGQVNRGIAAEFFEAAKQRPEILRYDESEWFMQALVGYLSAPDDYIQPSLSIYSLLALARIYDAEIWEDEEEEAVLLDRILAEAFREIMITRENNIERYEYSIAAMIFGIWQHDLDRLLALLKEFKLEKPAMFAKWFNFGDERDNYAESQLDHIIEMVENEIALRDRSPRFSQKLHDELLGFHGSKEFIDIIINAMVNDRELLRKQIRTSASGVRDTLTARVGQGEVASEARGQKLEELLRPYIKVEEASSLISDVGKGIAPTVNYYSIFVSNGFATREEIDSDREKYSNRFGRFGLERIANDDPTEIIKQVIKRIEEEGLDPRNVIVQLPKTAADKENGKYIHEDALRELTKTGAKFMIIDTAEKGANKEESRLNNYMMLLLALNVGKDTTPDSKSYRLLSCFIKWHLAVEKDKDMAAAIDEYVNAIKDNEIDVLASHILSYHPLEQYDAEVVHLSVTVPLHSA